MNYKIKVTAENREAIKDIAERNGMNEKGFNFLINKEFYIIENNIFHEPKRESANEELTFEQFKAMFDKENGAPFEEEKTKGFEEAPIIIHYIDAVDDIEVWNWFYKNFDSQDTINSYESFRDTFNFFGCFSLGLTPKFVFDSVEKKEEQLNAKLVKITLKEFKEKYMKAETQETDLEKWLREPKTKSKIIGFKAPFDMYESGAIKKGDIFVKCHKDTYSCKGYVFPDEIVGTWEPVFEVEHKYPIYCKSKIMKETEDTIFVVKFNDLQVGEVVLNDNINTDRNVGYQTRNWVAHTNTANWQVLPICPKTGFFHGQAVWCWDRQDTHQRTLGFYDAINRRLFSYCGIKNGLNWDIYEPYEGQYTDWMVKAFQTLEL